MSSDGSEQYDTINEFVIAGEFGFQRVAGPFSCEKEGTLWTVSVPTDEDDYAAPNTITLNSIKRQEGESAVIIADGKAVGGGVVELTHEPEGEGKLHVVINQYAMANPQVIEPDDDERAVHSGKEQEGSQ